MYSHRLNRDFISPYIQNFLWFFK